MTYNVVAIIIPNGSFNNSIYRMDIMNLPVSIF